MSPRGIKGVDKTELAWDTPALLRFLEAEWLRRGLDQQTFLTRAGITGSWASSLRSQDRNGMNAKTLAKIRATYGISSDTMLDILEGRARVDEYGNITRGAR